MKLGSNTFVRLLSYVVSFRICSPVAIGFIYFLVTGIKSAFSVSFAETGPTSGTIRFTHVYTNIGGQYSTSTGVFTCQYPGLYAFTLTLIKEGGYDIAYCRIRKNGSDKVFTYTNPDSNSDDGLYSATNSVVLHLVHGDKVDVGHCTPLASIYSYTGTSSFSGFLIKAD